MATKRWAFVLVLFTTLLTSVAQILFKKASQSLAPSITALISNYYLIGGLSLYAIGGIIMVIALRGGEVSVLFPIIATSYIWVSILSIFFLEENITPLKWIGIFIIIAGISLIGYGSGERGSQKSPAGVI